MPQELTVQAENWILHTEQSVFRLWHTDQLGSLQRYCITGPGEKPQEQDNYFYSQSAAKIALDERTRALFKNDVSGTGTPSGLTQRQKSNIIRRMNKRK